jgi:hypothetical protein
MVSTSPPVLAADLNAGLKRLKMAAMRRLAPELAGHGEDATMEPGGVPPHPGRGRDRRPGRLQRRHPTTPGRIPRDQNLGRLRPDRLLRAAGSVPLIDPAPGYRRIHGGLAGPRLFGHPQISQEADRKIR